MSIPPESRARKGGRVPAPKERDTQKLILDWLAAIGIAARRQNTGGRTDEYKGKRRYTAFGTPGQLDITGLIRRIGSVGS